MMRTFNKVNPWLFAILALPYGLCTGFVMGTLPYKLSQINVELSSIGWYAAVMLIPTFTQFLYAPMLDIGWRKKYWFIVFCLLTASCLAIASILPIPKHLTAVIGLVFIGQVFSGLVSSCCGGLMAQSLSNEHVGKGSGFYNAGILSGTGLAVMITLSSWMPKNSIVLAVILFFSMIFPCAFILFLPEGKSPARKVAVIFKELFSDIWTTLKSKDGMISILFLISPVGTVALTNFFTAIAKDYQASANLTALVNGPLNSVVIACGALIGGFICDRFNRRAVYIGGGLLTALVALMMKFLPLTSGAYIAGVLTYLFVAGFAYAAFSAVVLELIGKAKHSKSTQYAILISTGNLAIAYVSVLDTRFHKDYGVKGLFVSDAVLNILGVIFLVGILYILQRRAAVKK